MPNSELLPLFLAEASDRLVTLRQLCEGGLGDRESEERRAAKRELHTLKGAARLMGFGTMAELCHHAEDALDQAISSGPSAVLELLGEIQGELVRLEGAERGTTEGDRAGRPPAFVAPPMAARMSSEALDRISDRALRLSFLAGSVGTLVDEVESMARLAERGIGSGEPDQALARVGAGLHRLALKTAQAGGRFEGLIEEQLNEITAVQVQPVRPMLEGLARHAEELGQSLGKVVKARVDASNCLLDRRIMQSLNEALVHLVRNAVDHGIEPSNERRSHGKPDAGNLILRADPQAGRVRLSVIDDGRGIDPEVVRDRALERGLIQPDLVPGMPPAALRQLVFHPGFSTRSETTDLSGRGIGLDTVAETVRRIQGAVWIEGEPGLGLRVNLDLPVSRRGESILLVIAGGYTVGIAMRHVRHFGMVGRRSDDVDPSSHEIRLDRLFGRPAEGGHAVVSALVGGQPINLVVDEILGREEVFLHAWPRLRVHTGGGEALALLANGKPVAILDLEELLLRDRNGPLPLPRVWQPSPVRLLLVDDSRMTREMLRRLLRDGGVSVVTASSGEEALFLLERSRFDCVVTDIEMPGMSGLELTEAIRRRERVEHLPVVVVSTRNRPEDRIAGLEAGADVYLAKQSLLGDRLLDVVRGFQGEGQCDG